VAYLQFLGAAGTVTGSKHLINTRDDSSHQPGVQVLVKYAGTTGAAFKDPTKGKELALAEYQAGADIIFHASGSTGLGVFEAGRQLHKLAIGVDSDQYLTASADQKPLILTSMIKRVDTAVYNAIKQTGDGSFKGGPEVFDLAHQGLDYSKSNNLLMTPDIIATLELYRQDIINGTIKVPDKP